MFTAHVPDWSGMSRRRCCASVGLVVVVLSVSGSGAIVSASHGLAGGQGAAPMAAGR